MAVRRHDLGKAQALSLEKNKKRKLKAMEKQNRLAKKAGNWNSTRVIRECREKRSMS